MPRTLQLANRGLLLRKVTVIIRKQNYFIIKIIIIIITTENRIVALSYTLIIIHIVT